MAQDDRPDLSRVTYVHEVDPNMMGGVGSHYVNDYLVIEGWVLLGTGTHTGGSDAGGWASVYYSVGWIGEGEPQIPPG